MSGQADVLAIKLALERPSRVYGSTCNPAPIRKAIISAYSEPHRKYHKVQHLFEVLAIVFAREADIPITPELLLAALFHDFVYDPQAHDNEERSADAATECLKPLRLPESSLPRIRGLIMCTKTHKPDEGDQEAELLIDADLSILGFPEDTYRDYAKAIRQEYSFVSDLDYRNGRTKILQEFLDRDQIYFTDFFRDRFEFRARENLAREIAELNHGKRERIT